MHPVEPNGSKNAGTTCQFLKPQTPQVGHDFRTRLPERFPGRGAAPKGRGKFGGTINSWKCNYLENELPSTPNHGFYFLKFLINSFATAVASGSRVRFPGSRVRFSGSRVRSLGNRVAPRLNGIQPEQCHVTLSSWELYPG